MSNTALLVPPQTVSGLKQIPQGVGKLTDLFHSVQYQLREEIGIFQYRPQYNRLRAKLDSVCQIYKATMKQAEESFEDGVNAAHDAVDLISQLLQGAQPADIWELLDRFLETVEKLVDGAQVVKTELERVQKGLVQCKETSQDLIEGLNIYHNEEVPLALQLLAALFLPLIPGTKNLQELTSVSRRRLAATSALDIVCPISDNLDEAIRVVTQVIDAWVSFQTLVESLRPMDFQVVDSAVLQRSQKRWRTIGSLYGGCASKAILAGERLTKK